MKIGQTVTKEQFIKYAPYGLILKSSTNMFFYFNKNTTASRASGDLSIPGYVFGYKRNETFIDQEHIMNLWYSIHRQPVYRLPKIPVKRRQHV